MAKENKRQIKNTSVIDTTGLESADEQINESVEASAVEFNENDIINGTIVKIEHDEVLVDIGFKSEGVIPVRELTIKKDCNPEDVVSIGDEIEALVVTKEDKEGRLILSKKRAEYEKAWAAADEKYKSGEVVTGDVIEIVRGGLILDIGLRAFLPASLVDLHRVRDLESYLDTQIEARIIEMDKVRNNVVLSRRVLLEEGRRNERIEVLSKLSPGMRLKGKVSSIVDFGVFVDLGGIDGLVHISELSWDHIGHPSDIVKIGDEVEAVVLDVDLDRERISLGMKQTTEDPWLVKVREYPIGKIADAEVVRIVPFGAFVKVGDDIEGLIHVSEMADRHIESPSQVVHIGDVVKATVTEINNKKHRISLSIAAAAEELGIEVHVEDPMPENVTSRRRSKKVESAEPQKKTEKKSEKKKEEAPAEEKPAEKAEEKPVEEKPAKKAEEKPAEKVEEKPAEEAEKKADEKPAAKPAKEEKKEEAEKPAEEAPAEEK